MSSKKKITRAVAIRDAALPILQREGLTLLEDGFDSSRVAVHNGVVLSMHSWPPAITGNQLFRLHVFDDDAMPMELFWDKEGNVKLTRFKPGGWEAIVSAPYAPQAASRRQRAARRSRAAAQPSLT